MKFIIQFTILFQLSFTLKGQTTYDTLIYFEDRGEFGTSYLKNHSYGTNQDDKYQINGKDVTKYMYDSDSIVRNKLLSDSIKTYVVLSFDLNNKLISKSLYTKSNLIGSYIEYYETGQCKIKGQYCLLNLQEMKALKTDIRSAKDKVWVYYDTDGKESKKEVYVRGILKK